MKYTLTPDGISLYQGHFMRSDPNEWVYFNAVQCGSLANNEFSPESMKKFVSEMLKPKHIHELDNEITHQLDSYKIINANPSGMLQKLLDRGFIQEELKHDHIFFTGD